MLVFCLITFQFLILQNIESVSFYVMIIIVIIIFNGRNLAAALGLKGRRLHYDVALCHHATRVARPVSAELELTGAYLLVSRKSTYRKT